MSAGLRVECSMTWTSAGKTIGVGNCDNSTTGGTNASGRTLEFLQDLRRFEAVDGDLLDGGS